MRIQAFLRFPLSTSYSSYSVPPTVNFPAKAVSSWPTHAHSLPRSPSTFDLAIRSPPKGSQSSDTHLSAPFCWLANFPPSLARTSGTSVPSLPTPVSYPRTLPWWNFSWSWKEWSWPVQRCFAHLKVAAFGISWTSYPLFSWYTSQSWGSRAYSQNPPRWCPWRNACQFFREEKEAPLSV